jgi:hypothetical protein
MIDEWGVSSNSLAANEQTLGCFTLTGVAAYLE